MRSRTSATAPPRRRILRHRPAAGGRGAARVLAALAALLIGLSPLLLPAGAYHPQRWRGYATVLLRGAEVPPGVAAELAALPGLRGRPGERLLSAGTARVSFNAFDGMETVSLERLPGRLLAEDPRYDPWLRSLPRYFHVLLEGEPWSVVYLRTRLSAPLLEPALRRIAARGGSAARVLEADSGARWALAALAAAFLLTLLVPRLARGRGALPLAGALPWLANVASGGVADLLAFLLLFPPLLRTLEGWLRELREAPRAALLPALLRPAPSRLLRLGLLGLAVNLLLGPPASSSLPLRTAVAALLDLALLVLAAGLLRRGALRAGRRPFEPLPILPRLPWRAGRLRRALRPGRGGRPSPEGGRAATRLPAARRWRVPLRDAWAASSLLLVVLCLPLCLAATRGGGTAAPALADAPRVRPDDWTAMERLQAGERGARLPDLSDFAAHAAFQEGFPLGRPWRFPRPGERVTLSAYLPGREGGPVVQTRRTLKRYPPGWLAGTLAGRTAPSVERLLLDQGRAGPVGLETDRDRLLRRLPPWRIPLLALFFLLAAAPWELKLTDLPTCGTHKRFARRKHPIP